jgi:hypothetical protein
VGRSARRWKACTPTSSSRAPSAAHRLAPGEGLTGPRRPPRSRARRATAPGTGARRASAIFRQRARLAQRQRAWRPPRTWSPHVPVLGGGPGDRPVGAFPSRIRDYIMLTVT